MIRQYLPQTNKKCCSIRCDLFYQLFADLNTALVCHISQTVTASWTGSILSQPSSWWGKYGLDLGGTNLFSKNKLLFRLLKQRSTQRQTSRQKNRYIYRLCTHQRCHNNQGNSTEIHEDEKLSSHQAFHYQTIQKVVRFIPCTKESRTTHFPLKRTTNSSKLCQFSKQCEWPRFGEDVQLLLEKPGRLWYWLLVNRVVRGILYHVRGSHFLWTWVSELVASPHVPEKMEQLDRTAFGFFGSIHWQVH